MSFQQERVGNKYHCFKYYCFKGATFYVKLFWFEKVLRGFEFRIKFQMKAILKGAFRQFEMTLIHLGLY